LQLDLQLWSSRGFFEWAALSLGLLHLSPPLTPIIFRVSPFLFALWTLALTCHPCRLLDEGLTGVFQASQLYSLCHSFQPWQLFTPQQPSFLPQFWLQLKPHGQPFSCQLPPVSFSPLVRLFLSTSLLSFLVPFLLTPSLVAVTS